MSLLPKGNDAAPVLPALGSCRSPDTLGAQVRHLCPHLHAAAECPSARAQCWACRRSPGTSSQTASEPLLSVSPAAFQTTCWAAGGALNKAWQGRASGEVRVPVRGNLRDVPQVGKCQQGGVEGLT